MIEMKRGILLKMMGTRERNIK